MAATTRVNGKKIYQMGVAALSLQRVKYSRAILLTVVVRVSFSMLFSATAHFTKGDLITMSCMDVAQRKMLVRMERNFEREREIKIIKKCI
jgi:hypothetical protein